MKRRILFAGLLALLSAGASAQITVDVSNARSADEVARNADDTARQLASNLALATARVRADLARTGHFHPNHPLSFPTTLWLAKDGRVLPVPPSRGGRPPISGLTLVFDASGPRAFPPAYQAKLQGIFNSAQATLNSTFGDPAVSGNVAVKDYNADISDRGFFSGGFYIPNGGSPEIHFPEYADDASIAVNFVHVLLLAYLGPDQYGFDAFNEGLVRAATMKIARTSAALPGFDQAAIEAVIENSYDVVGFYDWYNQRALGGPRFVAANLANQPLNGSVGGLYLLRYRMAGSAWQKMIAEHPTFISTFNAAFYGNPGIASDVPSLVTLGQTTLNAIAPGNPTVEGLSFAEWFKRQFILETKQTSGRKLLVQPVPFTNNLQSGDFGPFLVQANYFQTLTNGDEALSTATSYPIYWQGDISLTRVFPGAQDERIDITSAYGSDSPNLPDVFGGIPYRATIDIPVADQLGRVYVPVGSIATGSNPTPHDFYGTVTGVFLQSADTMFLSATVNGASIPNVPVTVDGAFGMTVGTAAYLDYGTVTVNVIRHNTGGDTVLLTRTIDKGPGPLALDLRVATDIGYTYPNALPKGVSTVGFPVDPWASYNPDLVGATTLIARYDSATGHYDLFPDTEAFKIGHGYFIRSDTTQTPFTISGRVSHNIAGSVSLRPGWNMISSPLAETSSVDHVSSVHKTDFPRAFTDAQGSDIGAVFFEFQPGQNDGATGAPETGSLIPATTFQEGKAYFVLVLSPEGVTLVFTPQAGIAPHGSHSNATRNQGWLMGLTLIDGTFRVGAQIGQSTTATRDFDPSEDAQLPPAPAGGRQVVVTDVGSMYRDVRRLGVPEEFTFRLSGMKSGRVYTLNFDRIRNGPGVFALLKSDGSMVGYFTPGMQISFTATQPTMTLKIRVAGGIGQ